jgi:hypothetical protein
VRIFTFFASPPLQLRNNRSRRTAATVTRIVRRDSLKRSMERAYYKMRIYCRKESIKSPIFSLSSSICIDLLYVQLLERRYSHRHALVFCLGSFLVHDPDPNAQSTRARIRTMGSFYAYICHAARYFKRALCQRRNRQERIRAEEKRFAELIVVMPLLRAPVRTPCRGKNILPRNYCHNRTL